MAKPSDAGLEQVEEIEIRVHLPTSAIPLQGRLFVDAVRIR